MSADCPPDFVTLHGLATAAGLPSSTALRRLERLRIEPDAKLLRGHEEPAPLFRTSRLTELVETLQTKPK